MNDLTTKELSLQDNVLRLITSSSSSKNIESVIETNPVTEDELQTTCKFYHIESLSYDKDFPKREAFENVLESIGTENCNFVYVLSGDEKGVSLCLGVIQRDGGDKETAGKAIYNALEGNFNGTILKELKLAGLNKYVFGPNICYEFGSLITGIPSINENKTSDDSDFQGIDRIINGMIGKNWRLIVVCERASDQEINAYREYIYEIYNQISMFQKCSVQLQEGTSTSHTDGKNESYSFSTNSSDTKGSQTEHRNYNHQVGKTVTEDIGFNSGDTKGKNKGSSINFEVANKKLQEITKYIDEELLERIKLGASKGLFKTSIYCLADKKTSLDNLKFGIISLFQGNKSSFSSLVAKDFDKDCLKGLKNTFQLLNLKNDILNRDQLALLGNPVEECEGIVESLSTYLTGSEVSLIAGLPQKEVPGIGLKNSISFGLNTITKKGESTIELGHIVQKGRELPITFDLNSKALTKHTFIAGTTGSGKTTTCHRLLSEAQCPFLVIEPAKTEYRTLVQDCYREFFDDVTVFTVGNETCAPFRLNPFDLIEGEQISSHIDMVKAAFTSAFPMEASMPQILEVAINNCYKNKGWDVDTNENFKYENPFDPDVDSFPTLSELLDELPRVVQSNHFGAQMEGDYIGSLRTRLLNLTVGSKGAMLNCTHSVDFEKYIARKNVVLEFEELKSPEDKSLIMGFVLSKLSQAIKKIHKNEPDYKHITLVEEAHRLLSKIEYGDTGSKKEAVETFSDLLAEVRKYGEGLVIVDQIPNKLASEVLKNTNSKIVHKLFSKDDKEAIGATMLMDEEQSAFLSDLKPGEAIVFSENTPIPVHVKVQAISNTNEAEIKDELVKNHFLELLNNNSFGTCYDGWKVRTAYRTFANIYDAISKKKVTEEQLEILDKKISYIQNEFNLQKKQIYKILLKKLCLETGFVVASEEIIKLADFFSNEAAKTDFISNLNDDSVFKIEKDMLRHIRII